MIRLREETRTEHVRLETFVDIPTRLASNESYRWLLKRFYGFYLPFEPALREATPELGLDMTSRTKLPSLERDLVALGIDPQTVPLCSEIPELDEGQAVGAWYVLEGSTLGGQIISRMLAERRQIGLDNGGAFFAGYGGENGPMWRSFGAAANEWLIRHEATADAVVGAKITFAAIERWMKEEE